MHYKIWLKIVRVVYKDDSHSGSWCKGALLHLFWLRAKISTSPTVPLNFGAKISQSIDVLLAKCSHNGFHSSVIGPCNTYHPLLIRVPVRALFGTCVCMFIMCDVERDVLSCADTKAACTIVTPFCFLHIQYKTPGDSKMGVVKNLYFSPY